MEHLRKITMNVYVRTWDRKKLPSQREVENKIASLLLAMPRDGEEGYEGWDVSATSIPGEENEAG
jgi:hypothetical protein